MLKIQYIIILYVLKQVSKCNNNFSQYYLSTITFADEYTQKVILIYTYHCLQIKFYNTLGGKMYSKIFEVYSKIT